MSRGLIIFDNDGVLVDSERLANQVLAAILTDLWRPITFEDCVASYLGGTIERVRGLVEEESGCPLPGDFEDRYHRALYAAFDDGLVAVPGASELLDRLDHAGTPYCVASSGSRERISRTLRQVGLWDRFDGKAFSAEDVSAGKPAPDLFLHAASRSGVAPTNSVVIEDSPLGVEAARAARMPVIGFVAVTPPERLAGANSIATTMDEVGDLLTESGLVAPRAADQVS